MTDPSATFAVELRDDTSGPAGQAANSLVQLKAKIEGGTKALREMQGAMRRLKGGTSTNVAAFKELRDRIAAQKASLANAQASYVALGGTFGKTTQAAQAASGGFGELLSKAQGMPGPLGGMVSRLMAIRGLVAGGIAAGILAIAAASVALIAATAGAATALLRYGVAQSDARRSELLRIEGLNTLHHWMGRVRASAGEFQAAMDRASDSTNVGRGQLETYARQLARTGLAGESLSSALEAMAIAQQVQGDRGAARFRAQVANARLTGRSVEAVAEAYRARLGPIARRQMLELGNQTARLRRSLDRIFSGLRIEGFLSAIDQVASLFSQTTASGQALKTIVEVLFQPLIDGLATVGPIARRFFQGMILAAQQIAMHVLRLAIAFRRTFGGSEILSGLDAQKIALYAGAAAVVLFVAGLAAAVTVVAAVAYVLAGLAAVTATFAAPFVLAVAAIAGLVAGARRAYVWFQSTDWTALGASIADGLVQGLRAGAARVAGAIRGLASEARSALTSALQIRSPSRVFAGLGEQISAGVAVGIDAGVPRVEASVDQLVSVPTGGGGGGGASVSIGDVHIHAGGDGDGRTIAAEFVDELVTLLEGAGIQLGAPA